MSWWNLWKQNKKQRSNLENLCHVCGIQQLPDEPAILRLSVQDGTAEMLVCDECADFFDQSAEILNRGKRDESI